jgi:hypothetical protein
VRLLGLVAPYAAAILIYLISPLLAQQVRSVVNGTISAGGQHAGPATGGDIPFYITPESISDYVDYAMDAVQVFPVMILPIVGSVYSFAADVPTAVSASFLSLASVATVGMTAWVLTRSPSDYVSRRWLGYSVLSIIGMAVNVAGIALAVAFG